MLVVWHSAENEPDAQVKWSFTSGGPYTFSAPSIPHSYDREDLCGYPTSVATSVGWSDPLTWHYARITGLTPGGDIVYYVYGSDTNGYSTELSFKPAPPVQAKQSLPIHIIAIADMGMTPYDGTQNHWQEPDAGLTTDHMRDFVQSGTGYDYSIVLHPGDIVYSTGYALKWDLFTSRIEGVADRVPYMLGQGYVFIVILLLVSIHLTLFSLPPSLSLLFLLFLLPLLHLHHLLHPPVIMNETGQVLVPTSAQTLGASADFQQQLDFQLLTLLDKCKMKDTIKLLMARPRSSCSTLNFKWAQDLTNMYG
jgi:hypothetical protein